MIFICKIWFHIMNLYVISFKSIYSTLKMDLKWTRYRFLNFMFETCVFGRKKLKGWRLKTTCTPAHHVFHLPKRLEQKIKKEATCTSRAREIEKIKNENEGSHNSLFLKCIYSIIICMYCKYKPIGHIWVFLSFVRFSYYMHIKPIDKWVFLRWNVLFNLAFISHET